MALDYSLTARDGETQSEKLLVEAAAKGDVKTVTRLLKAGVSVDADEYNKALFYASKNYMTPLQLASANNNVSCVDILIANGADVNAKDRFDVTAMHMAAEKGHYSCLKALLNANAECSLPTKFSKTGCYTAVPHPGGTTPLHLAATYNHVDCVRELIQYGADYNAVDERGRTSLYISAQFGHKECVLAHLKNAVGRDILSLPSFETGDTPLHFAVSHCMIECVGELLNSGSDANHLNYAGYSPLHIAVSPTNENESTNECMEILKLLVLEGYNTDINQHDGEGLTPLHYVSFNGGKCFRRPKMAKFLISYGANVNIKCPSYGANVRGSTLLEYELKLPSENFEILRFIVKSMLHPPHFSKLRVVPHWEHAMLHNPQGPVFPLHESFVWKAMVILNTSPNVAYRGALAPSPSRVVPPEATTVDHKHVWYETVSSNPRTLQHYCRYTIRYALGPRSIKYIKQMRIPVQLRSYLLLEHDE